MSSETLPATLTVALITRDAEDLLAVTLDSVRFIADEILIVDTGSTDRTKSIATALGAKLLTLLWSEDFSAPRNLAMAQAQSGWILWLDAGETLSATDAHALKLFLAEHAKPSQVYYLTVATPGETPQASAELVRRIRLVPNFAGLRFTGRVREHMHESALAAGRSLASLPVVIQRSTHDLDPHVKARKARRDLRLAELEMQQHGWSARMLNLMGDAYSRLGDIAPAVDYFRRALQYAERGGIDMLESYYGMLAAWDSEPAQRGEQLATCLKALEIYSFDAQLLCAMGSYLQNQGRFDLASQAYETAAQHGQIEPELWHLSDIQEVAAICWSMCLQLLDQDATAVSVLEQALAQGGASPRLRRQLIELYVKRERRQDALDQVQALALESSQREAFRTGVRGACLAAKQNWSAAAGYLQTAYNAGCREPVCLRWYAVTLLALADYAGAEPILRAWRDVEPRNPELLQYWQLVTAERGEGVASTLISSMPPLPATFDGSRNLRLEDGNDSPLKPNLKTTSTTPRVP